MGIWGYSIIKTKEKAKDPDTTWLKRNYLISASAVAIVTAFVSLKIIYWMNADGLDLGLGLASIGIVTFIGTILASSIFEEHRHDHNDKSKDNKEKSKNQFLQDTIVGKGIMRKALAASLVMTYIVLIGMSYSDGSIENLWDKGIITNSTSMDANESGTATSMGNNGSSIYIASSNNSTILINSNNVSPEIGIKDIVKIDGKLKAISTTAQSTPSNSLVQHFTTIISLVIGFYFASNMVTAAINSKKKQLTGKEILDIRLTSGEIKKEEYAEKMDLIKEKSPKE